MRKSEPSAKGMIAEAATALLRETGDAGQLSVRNIAARCGVGVGLLNYHFQTKENLIDLCTRRALDPLFDELDSLGGGAEDDPMACLRRMAKRYLAFLAGDPGMARASLMAALQCPNPKDHCARAQASFLPAVRALCRARATDREMRMLAHLLLDTVQAAFLRESAFREDMGFDLATGAQRDQFVDFTIYILFHKYL